MIWHCDCKYRHSEVYVLRTAALQLHSLRLLADYLQCDFNILCFLTVHPCIISQISPTTCTILFYICISLRYMCRTSMCPSLGENYYIYATLVSVTLYEWCLFCWLDWIEPADQTPPIQSDKHQRCKDTVIFSWWWAHGFPKHVEKWNK